MTSDEVKNMLGEFAGKVEESAKKEETLERAIIEVARDDFDNAKLRQAIEMAMNSEDLCDTKTQELALHAWKVLWSHRVTY